MNLEKICQTKQRKKIVFEAFQRIKTGGPSFKRERGGGSQHLLHFPQFKNKQIHIIQEEYSVRPPSWTKLQPMYRKLIREKSG